MTALLDALVRVTPRPVKAKLRRDGAHRKAGRPFLVNMRLTAPSHRAPGVFDLDPTQRYWYLNDLERGGNDG